MNTTIKPVELTEEQQAALDFLLHSNQTVKTLGGYAGTGKTSVIWHLRQKLPGFAVCAFTGKAANVLRRKGVPASTIHSLIYVPAGSEDEPSWHLLPPELMLCEGFVVDEASMVSREIHNDLKSYGLPIIYVGDHGQLEPVTVGESGFNLMAHPDVTLEKIHRNAGEIARFAEWLRKGESSDTWDYSGDKVNIITANDLNHWVGDDADQIVCAFNKTRVNINQLARDHLGFKGGPQVGDRVMCLQNNRDLGLFNGMQGTVERVNGSTMRFNSDGHSYPVQFVPEQFNSEKRPKFERERVPFDYCYAVTCHKAQGDEWPHVMVLEQFCQAWDHRRWAYTAASRARDKLTWVKNVSGI